MPPPHPVVGTANVQFAEEAASCRLQISVTDSSSRGLPKSITSLIGFKSWYSSASPGRNFERIDSVIPA